MRRALRTRIGLAASIIGVVLLSIISLTYVSTIRAERRARRLLSDCRKLKIGVSTELDVLRIVHDYGGEAGALATDVCRNGTRTDHSVAITSSSANWIGEHFPWLRPFSNRWWVAEALFAFENGHLCFVSYDVRTYLAPRSRYNLWVSAAAHSNSLVPDADAYGVSVGPKRNLEYFRTEVWANATPDQREHAFDFDLSCLTSWGGCRAGCELMPSAWRNYQQEAHERGWPLPPEETGDSRCQRL